MPFNNTGIDLLIAQQRQHVFPLGFAREDADFNPPEPTPFIVFLHLPIGLPVPPALTANR
jgi:hypothetical protein